MGRSAIAVFALLAPSLPAAAQEPGPDLVEPQILWSHDTGG